MLRQNALTRLEQQLFNFYTSFDRGSNAAQRLSQRARAVADVERVPVVRAFDCNR